MMKAYAWAVARVTALLDDKNGASLLEYALLIAIGVLTVAVGAQIFSTQFRSMTDAITNKVSTATSTST